MFAGDTLKAAFEYPVIKLTGESDYIPEDLGHVKFVRDCNEGEAIREIGLAATANIENTEYNAGVWVQKERVVSEENLKDLYEWRASNFIFYNASRADKMSDISLSELRCRDRETGTFKDFNPEIEKTFSDILSYQARISSLLREQFANVSVQPFIRSGEAHTTLSRGRPNLKDSSIDLHFDSDGPSDRGLLFRMIETIVGPSTIICPNDSCTRGTGNSLILKTGASSYEIPNNSLLSISHTAMEKPIAHGRPRASLCSIARGEEMPRVVLLWDVYKNISPA